MAVHMALQDIGEVIRYQAAIRAEKVALTFEGRETTYGQLDRRATRVANGLRAISTASQTRVALVAKNSDFFYEVLFGAAKARDVVVAVNWRLAPAEIVYIINDAGAEVLFVGEESVPLIAHIRPELHTVQTVIALGGEGLEWDSYMAWCHRQDSADPLLASSGGDVILQLYTSGTTGHPKGAQITHGNLFAALQAAREWYPCTVEDVNLACMPQFHIGGSLMSLIPLYVGARDVIAREPVAGEILHLIPTERVTLAFFVPAFMLSLLQTPGCQEVDFSSLKRVCYGASPIPLDLLRDAMATFRCEFAHLYGLTETTGVVTVLPPEDHDPAGGPRMRSCGKALSNAEIKVVDSLGAQLPPDRSEKLWCAPDKS